MRLAEKARNDFIIPGYKRLQERVQALQGETDVLCAKPSEVQLTTVRKAYRDAIDAWGQIELITFGPISERNRLERFFFWPDRKSIGARQVRRLVAGRNESALQVDELANMSVAVQGLTALEILLHSKGSSDLSHPSKADFRCRFALAAAKNLQRMTKHVLQSWSDGGKFAGIWKSPGPQNPIYLKAAELSLELVKALDQSLEGVRDRRIVPALGFGRTRRKHRPILWRSKLSMVLIHANLVGARDLFEQGGLAEAYVMSQRDQGRARDTLSSVESEFKLVLRATQGLADTPDPFALPDIRGRLIVVGFPLKSIRRQAVPLIKAAAGLSIGFNASDGD